MHRFTQTLHVSLSPFAQHRQSVLKPFMEYVSTLKLVKVTIAANRLEFLAKKKTRVSRHIYLDDYIFCFAK